MTVLDRSSGKGTEIVAALECARDEFDTTTEGDCSAEETSSELTDLMAKMPKILLLFTDGADSFDSAAILDFADQFSSLDVELFPLCVGSESACAVIGEFVVLVEETTTLDIDPTTLCATGVCPETEICICSPDVGVVSDWFLCYYRGRAFEPLSARDLVITEVLSDALVYKPGSLSYSPEGLIDPEAFETELAESGALGSFAATGVLELPLIPRLPQDESGIPLTLSFSFDVISTDCLTPTSPVAMVALEVDDVCDDVPDLLCPADDLEYSRVEYTYGTGATITVPIPQATVVCRRPPDLCCTEVFDENSMIVTIECENRGCVGEITDIHLFERLSEHFRFVEEVPCTGEICPTSAELFVPDPVVDGTDYFEYVHWSLDSLPAQSSFTVSYIVAPWGPTCEAGQRVNHSVVTFWNANPCLGTSHVLYTVAPPPGCSPADFLCATRGRLLPGVVTEAGFTVPDCPPSPSLPDGFLRIARDREGPFTPPPEILFGVPLLPACIAMPCAGNPDRWVVPDTSNCGLAVSVRYCPNPEPGNEIRPCPDLQTVPFTGVEPEYYDGEPPISAPGEDAECLFGFTSRFLEDICPGYAGDSVLVLCQRSTDPERWCVLLDAGGCASCPSGADACCCPLDTDGCFPCEMDGDPELERCCPIVCCDLCGEAWLLDDPWCREDSTVKDCGCP